MLNVRPAAPIADQTFAWVILAMLVVGCNRPTSGPAVAALPTSAAESKAAKDVTLLNVSYDPTRELYQRFNADFAEYWQRQTGQTVHFQQSHGGSGKQARAVIDGLEADIVTLALAYDTDTIVRKAGLIDKDWQQRLPNNSAPYRSTIVFLVRPGNPKGIKDWHDLVQGDTKLVAANPKTGGGARWNYLAAWGAALHRELGSLDKLHDPAATEEVVAAQAKAREFVGEVYRRMLVLDSGARGATMSFLQRGQGDALICWENEAYLAVNELGADQAEIVVPSISVLAEPPVAVVDKNVDRHGTRAVAEAYLRHLYTPAGQTLVAKNFYRPALPDTVDPALLARFPRLATFTVDDAFGGWERAQAEHFDDGGVFDQIFQQ